MMRRGGNGFPAAALPLAVLFSIPATIVAADEPRPVSKGDRMAAIVAALRAEEAKYRDIEYVARIVIRDASRKDPADPADVTTMATRRVVLQGDRSYFRYEGFERIQALKGRKEQISAYDGEKTRTVTAGNCANIHLGQFRHPDVYPSHGLPLAHYNINFPLSVYLSGTRAIHAYLAYPQELVDAGPSDVFFRVVAHFEAEELLDGLRCLKVRMDRWYRHFDEPITQYIWLAPERNYHCVKEQCEGVTGVMTCASKHCASWRQASGSRRESRSATTRSRDRAPRKKDVVKRTETILEKVDLAPNYEAPFFRDISMPADLPVFTIKDRKLVGSILPEPIDGDRPQTGLLRIAARVAKEENRYEDIEVKVKVRTYRVNPYLWQWNPLAEESWDDRSILRGELAYHTTRRMQASRTGWELALYEVAACDGQWSRSLWGSDPQNPQGLGVILRPSRVRTDNDQGAGITVYRPHMLLLRDQEIFGRLADLLASPRFNRASQTTLQFRDCGTAEVDGHLCRVVRGDLTDTGRKQLYFSMALYLATDRNDIPIKMELFGSNFANPLMATGISRCDDFREIAPGLWYPFRVTKLGFDNGAPMGQGWLLVNWRREYTIESVTLAPKLDDAIFRNVIAPAGAVVHVRDEIGRSIGEFPQTETGIPSITPERYQELVSQMKARVAKQQARLKPSP